MPKGKKKDYCAGWPVENWSLSNVKVIEVLKTQEVLTIAGTVLDHIRGVKQDSPIWGVN